MLTSALGRVFASIQRARKLLNDGYYKEKAEEKERLRIIWNRFSEGQIDTLQALRVCALLSLTVLLLLYDIHKVSGIRWRLLKFAVPLKPIVLFILEHYH